MEDCIDYNFLKDYVKKISSNRQYNSYVETKHPLIRQFLEEIEAGETLPALLDYQIRKEIVDNIINIDINDEFYKDNRRIAIKFCGRSYVLLVNSCGELFLIPKDIYDKL